MSEVIDVIFRYCGQKETVIFCDKIKTLGFKHAFKAGISFGKDDLLIPKTNLLNEITVTAEHQVKSISDVEKYSINDFVVLDNKIYRLEYHGVLKKYILI